MQNASVFGQMSEFLRVFTKLFARFVVKNDLNAIFGPNEYIFSVKIIIFIKKYKKTSFFKTYWQNP